MPKALYKNDVYETLEILDLNCCPKPFNVKTKDFLVATTKSALLESVTWTSREVWRTSGTIFFRGVNNQAPSDQCIFSIRWEYACVFELFEMLQTACFL